MICKRVHRVCRGGGVNGRCTYAFLNVDYDAHTGSLKINNFKVLFWEGGVHKNEYSMYAFDNVDSYGRPLNDLPLRASSQPHCGCSAPTSAVRLSAVSYHHVHCTICPRLVAAWRAMNPQAETAAVLVGGILDSDTGFSK